MKNYHIVLTETAKQDLRDIAFYLSEKSGDKKIAIKFVNELREQTRQLILFPESGALPKDRILKSLGYRFLVHKDYLLFYHVDEQKETVYVTAIFNGKKDYMRVMKRFL